MTVYTVHEPPPREGQADADTDRFVFVRDGFYFWAFLFGPLWMIWRRLWLVLILYLIVTIALQVGLHLLGVSNTVKFVVGFMIALLVGFEAASLRRWTYWRRGWRNPGVVVGPDVETAERRFFDSWMTHGAPRVSAVPPPAMRVPEAVPQVLGLFPRARAAPMTTAIIDYGSGNLHSAAKAFERAARETGHGEPIVVTRDPGAVRRADRVVLPGVGAFADCRRGLDAVPGMVAALDETVRARSRPFLGICVGMQLMAERGREYVVTDGFGWIGGEVDRIAPADPVLKIPHMGWNTLAKRAPHALLDGIPLGPDGLHAYFVHSYELKPADGRDLVAQADYGGPVTAMVARDNMAGTQFHPEKSQKLGLALIANFLKWKP